MIRLKHILLEQEKPGFFQFGKQIKRINTKRDKKNKELIQRYKSRDKNYPNKWNTDVTPPHPVGSWIAYHDQNREYPDKVSYKGQFNDNGKQQGYWEYFHRNGEPRMTGNWDAGKKVRTWTYFSKQGKKIRQENYKNGKLDGEYTEYHDSGEEKTDGIYKNGKKDFVWSVYDKSGDLINAYTYKNGVLNGPFAIVKKSKTIEGDYINGKKDRESIETTDN
jgi:antitoxin component YwqK of YwqJK toxin-antitoxin module